MRPWYIPCRLGEQLKLMKLREYFVQTATLARGCREEYFQGVSLAHTCKM